MTTAQAATKDHSSDSPVQPSLFSIGDPNARTPEQFFRSADGRLLTRRVVNRSGAINETVLLSGTDDSDSASAYDHASLRLNVHPEPDETKVRVRIVDLFSGCGGLTLGVSEACRAAGYEPEPILAIDTDAKALSIFGRNFPSAELAKGKVEELFDRSPGEPLSSGEIQVKDRLGRVGMVVGGPPCQGHSDLNNHTRNDDPKNELYERMARVAEVLQPDHLIIENVPGVIRDRSGVVDRTHRALRELGYLLSTSVVKGEEIGLAQSRHRYFTIASRIVEPNLPAYLALMSRPSRSVAWAIEDLLVAYGGDVFNSSAVHSAENQRRMQFLFDHALYDLPDEERPDCHRLKEHSYRAVYGRLHWGQPAPTLTRGFAYTGRGRYVHPLQPRTLTPHEAARLQSFPDYFDFGDFGRSTLQNVIGNAVPPKMAYVAALELLR